MRAQALYDYAAREEGELSFNEGDVILVEEAEDEWWYGRIGGMEGEFPFNYVQVLDEERRVPELAVESGDQATDDARPVATSAVGKGASSGVSHPAPVDLPPGWAMALDPESGDPYFYDTETWETTWEHPGLQQQVHASTREALSPTPRNHGPHDHMVQDTETLGSPASNGAMGATVPEEAKGSSFQSPPRQQPHRPATNRLNPHGGDPNGSKSHTESPRAKRHHERQHESQLQLARNATHMASPQLPIHAPESPGSFGGSPDARAAHPRASKLQGNAGGGASRVLTRIVGSHGSSDVTLSGKDDPQAAKGVAGSDLDVLVSSLVEQRIGSELAARDRLLREMKAEMVELRIQLERKSHGAGEQAAAVERLSTRPGNSSSSPYVGSVQERAGVNAEASSRTSPVSHGQSGSPSGLRGGLQPHHHHVRGGESHSPQYPEHVDRRARDGPVPSFVQHSPEARLSEESTVDAVSGHGGRHRLAGGPRTSPSPVANDRHNNSGPERQSGLKLPMLMHHRDQIASPELEADQFREHLSPGSNPATPSRQFSLPQVVDTTSGGDPRHPAASARRRRNRVSPKFDDNLPRVARLQRKSPGQQDERDLVHGNAARLGVKYHQCKTTVYPPSSVSTYAPLAASVRDADSQPPDTARSGYRVPAEAFPSTPPSRLAIDCVYGYHGDWGRDPVHQSRMTNVFVIPSTGHIVFPTACLVVIHRSRGRRQRIFSQHTNEVTALAQSPQPQLYTPAGSSSQMPSPGQSVGRSPVAIFASGQYGKGGSLLVWAVYSTRTSPASSQSTNGALPAIEEEPSQEIQDTTGDSDIQIETLAKLSLLSEGEADGAKFFGSAVKALQFSPCGQLLVCMEGGAGHPLSVWKWMESQCLVKTKGGNQLVHGIRFNPVLFAPIGETPTPSYTLTSYGVRHIKFWSLYLSDKPAAVVGHKSNPTAFGHAHVNPSLPTGAHNQQRAWKLEGSLASPTGGAGRNSSQPQTDVTCTVFMQVSQGDRMRGAPPTARVIAGTVAGTLTIWTQLEDISGRNRSDEVYQAYVDEDGESYHPPVLRWQPRGKLLSSLPAHDGMVMDMAVLGESDVAREHGHLASAGRDGKVLLWEVMHLRQGQTSHHGAGWALQVKQSITVTSAAPALGVPRAVQMYQSGRSQNGYGEGLRMLIGTMGNSICVLKLASADTKEPPDLEVLLQGPAGRLLAIDTHPFEKLIASVASDRSLRLWDVNGRRMLAIAKLPEVGTSLAYHPAGEVLAVGHFSGEVSIMQWTGGGVAEGSQAWSTVVKKSLVGKQRRSIGSQPQYASPDGKKAARTSPGESNAAQGVHAVKALRFCPSGKILAAGCKDGLVHLLDQDLQRLHVCRGHSAAVCHLDFNQEGRVLQTNDVSKEILYWDATAGKQISNAFRLRDERWATWTCPLGWPVQGIWDSDLDYEVTTLTRSHRGDSVVTVGDHHTLKVGPFPCLPGAEAYSYLVHCGQINCTAFLADDNMVFSAGSDSCIIQWRVLD